MQQPCCGYAGNAAAPALALPLVESGRGRVSGGYRLISSAKLSCTSGFNARHHRHEGATRSVPSTSPSYLPTSPTNDVTSIFDGEGPDASLYIDSDDVTRLVASIKTLLSDLGDNDGVINECPYDTAWVARVPALDGSHKPQFQRSVDWIIRNQLPDGSWGDEVVDVLPDRILRTLACLVALATWKTGYIQIQKGVEYVWKNMHKLAGTDSVRMPAGFELIIPTMLDDAKELGLVLPYDSPILQELAEIGRLKRDRIPMESLYSRATTLMYSLEGLKGMNINWDRVLKLQLEDGSIMCSPAATAFVLMNTKDDKCLQYLEKIVHKFDGAAPNFYPFDVYHKLWVVDILERLGIDRHFKDEIANALEYCYSAWSDTDGLGWSKLLSLKDIDDTSMGFRLLRMHGYDVKDSAFKNFQKGEEFVCWEGQLVQGVSDMFTLYRAAQTAYPGEETLSQAAVSSKKFLETALAKNMVNADKWSMKKNLYGEVRYGMTYPQNFGLCRLEINSYIEEMYGADDPWVAKTVHRLPLMNNRSYLALAKADKRLCQSYYRRELQEISKWLCESRLDSWTFTYERSLESYLVFAAEFWQPEYAAVRTVGTKCAILSLYLHEIFYENHTYLQGHRQIFMTAVERWDPALVSNLPEKFQACFIALWTTVNSISAQANSLQGRDVSRCIRQAWERLVAAFLKEAEWRQSKTTPSLEEYWDVTRVAMAGECHILSCLFFTGEKIGDEVMAELDTRSSFWRNSSLYARLVLDLGPSMDALSLPRILRISPSTISCYMKEHPNTTEEAAMNHLVSLKENLVKKLNLSTWGHRVTPVNRIPIPFICRKLVMSAAKIIAKMADLWFLDETCPRVYLTSDETILLNKNVFTDHLVVPSFRPIKPSVLH